MPQLQAEWRGRMSPQELDALSRLEKLIGGDAQPQDDNAASRGVSHAISHEFERRSVIPERKLLTTALKHAVGHALPEQVMREVDRSGIIIGRASGQADGDDPRGAGGGEADHRFRREGRGTLPALGKRDRKLKRDWLNASQQSGGEAHS